MVVVTFITRLPDRSIGPHSVDAESGQSLMQAALQAGVRGIEGECGGTMVCATCHVYVAPEWIGRLPAPSEDELAMLEGAVWGGACDLAFSCDILVGCPTTSFTMTPAKIGVPYNVTGILHFMNMLPVNAVREMFFTALPLGADAAYRLGVLNDLVPIDELERFTYEKAAVIGRNSPLSISAIKEQIRLLSMAHPLTPNMFELIQGLRRRVYDSRDYQEGIQSFFEKRPPVFTGE